MTSNNHIERIAIVGAGGSCGRSITEGLLKNGKHTLTALTRQGSSNSLPSGVKTAYIDYDKPQTLVVALQGQDALIITLPTGALSGLQTHLIQAAAKAGVRWVLPNEWAQDSEHAGIVADMGLQSKAAARREIADLGVSSFVGIVTGPWYEWGVGKPEAFGFDLQRRTATFYDRGRTKICTSTWAQVGRAVAALLSLPLAGAEPSLEAFRNRLLYVSSFTVTQEEVFASILRVTSQRREDWTVAYEPSKDRFLRAQLGNGLDSKVAVRMKGYARIFFPDDAANFEKTGGTVNAALGLPVENIDDATKHAMDLLNE